jgi:hypothetical protein
MPAAASRLSRRALVRRAIVARGTLEAALDADAELTAQARPGHLVGAHCEGARFLARNVRMCG